MMLTFDILVPYAFLCRKLLKLLKVYDKKLVDIVLI